MKFIKKIKNPILRELIDWSMHIGIAIIVTLLIVNFLFQRTIVSQISMTPTLSEGDNLIVNKLSKRFGLLERGDIITFYSERQKETLIKRIIGVSGDTVKISEGKVYVNGNQIKEDYIKGNFTESTQTGEEVKINKGYVYVLGDNRVDNIIDSRVIGPVKISDVEGEVFVRLWPIKSIRFF